MEKTKELFDLWNKEKKYLHLIESNIYISPREIWYIKMGINLGNEQNGKGEFKRPILVIKRIGNMIFGYPLTTKGKDNKYYIGLNTLNLNKKSYIITSQGRVYDKKRFTEKVGKIKPEEFYEIKKLLKNYTFKSFYL